MEDYGIRRFGRRNPARGKWMKRGNWLRFALFLAVFIPVACQQMPIDQAAPKLTPTPESGIPAMKLDAGREVYVSRQKCAGCHSPKPVFEYTAERWTNKILPGMGLKAKLNPDDYAAVLAYVTTGAKAVK